jgi:hypothetical protein
MQDQSINNPYTAPNTAGAASVAETGNGVITPRMLEGLRRTKGWILFFAIMSTINLVIQGLQFIVELINTPAQAVGTLIGLAISIVLVVFLYKFQGAIGKLLRSNNPNDLADAFNAQRIYFLILGILTIIFLVLIGIALIGGILVGLAGGIR